MSRRYPRHRYRCVVITGNIASGKSTVCRILKNLGHRVLSADQEVHALLRQKAIQSEVISHLPKPSAVKRKNFKDLIRRNLFSNKRFRLWYLPWIHDQVMTRLKMKIDASEPSKSRTVFVDIPLYFESAYRTFFPQYVWLVYTSRALRRSRWQRRHRASYHLMKKIEKFQIPDEQKFKKADIILKNDRGLSHLRWQVLRALEQART